MRGTFGLGLANNLLRSSHAYFPISSQTPAYVHRLHPDGTWQPSIRFELSEAVSRGLRSLRLNDPGTNFSATQKDALLAKGIRNIETALRAGTPADQTLLASQWLFDSYSGQDLLLSFVQSMVVLEILLGDKSASDILGIGELISNRFAYLVGTTHTERGRFIAEFKEIYKIRSQIVHSGKSRLTKKEQFLLARLKWMAGRTITKEIDLLEAAKDEALIAAIMQPSPPNSTGQ